MKYVKFKDVPKFTRDGNYQVDFWLESLVDFIENEVKEQNLQLNPNFQRGHVWTEQQQISYIEYFLKGGNSGNIMYFNNPSWHYRVKDGDYCDYVCVDGLQRYTAISRFIHNEIKVFGSYYDEFIDKRFLRLNYTIKINVNDLKTEKEVLQWYVDMNAGGTPHTSEEILKVKSMINELEKEI